MASKILFWLLFFNSLFQPVEAMKVDKPTVHSCLVIKSCQMCLDAGCKFYQLQKKTICFPAYLQPPKQFSIQDIYDSGCPTLKPTIISDVSTRNPFNENQLFTSSGTTIGATPEVLRETTKSLEDTIKQALDEKPLTLTSAIDHTVQIPDVASKRKLENQPLHSTSAAMRNTPNLILVIALAFLTCFVL